MIELEYLGKNPIVTITFWGTVFFTLLEGWGVLQQIRGIRKNRSAASLSTVWFTYLTAFFSLTFILGVALKSGAIVLNGLLAFLYAGILGGIWRFKTVFLWERWFGRACAFVIGVFVFVPIGAKEGIFLVFSLCGVLLDLAQPIEVIRNKNAGVLNIKLLVVVLITLLFWTVFAYHMELWVLKVTLPIHVLTVLFTVILWFRYPKDPTPLPRP